MLRVVGIATGPPLLDPWCGAGTILAEAGKFGAAGGGGDSDMSAVSAGRVNVSAAGVSASINAWDACALPIPDGSVERIVSNLPWGRQITISGGLSHFYRD